MLSPDELVAAVQAALDETERLAATGSWGPFDSFRQPQWRCELIDEQDPRTGEWRKRYAVVAGSHARAFTGEVTPRLAEHIAHHDPAAVLRRVAADRRVLARHQPVEAKALSTAAAQVGAVRDGAACRYCLDVSDGFQGPVYVDAGTDAVFPCPDFRDLADRVGVTIQEGSDG